MTVIRPLDSLDSRRFETAPILRKLASSSRQLAELKGDAKKGEAIYHNEQGVNCIRCHQVGSYGGNPHPRGWQSARSPKDSMCRYCHG